MREPLVEMLEGGFREHDAMRVGKMAPWDPTSTDTGAVRI